MNYTSEVIKLLKQKSVQPTPMRMLVLEEFLKSRTAKSLQELEQLLPHADRITIYRTLKTFDKQGIIHQVDDGTGVQRYASCSDQCSEEAHQDVHPHFHCVVCEDTICMKATRLPYLSLPSGFQTEKIALRIDGVCPKCKAA
ncbi:Fur family transcriptional regulator [Flavilitoribacter nigricans]|uniref:Transcriptional repressor n=1 Tax=Flavilitoribacter nigricans (strain ATCC 23147 / DSM 23189 / NBRC 102662 / NCIMB 1420 / SS-2) TaxID=1122177 RepID=A0A2D0NGN0_FLAN2|nr:transcriptional repressor [Flavilitoribacter nigricans]PHN07664.1 transcriptional repressor [Flavilitoribacter nigricans DSM 23189 = NBRC 102662]